jgi:3-oxoadipate enol-lactonase
MAEFVLEGVRLYFEESGQGLAMILVHGYPFDHTLWSEVVAQWKDKGRLIVPDLRGHGRSQATPGAVGMERLADDLLGLMDHLHLARAVLVGHSMSGYACLNFALRYPRRLAGLGLVATTSAADTAERAQSRRETARLVADQGVGSVAESMPLRLTSNALIQARLRALIARTPVEGMVGALLGMAERLDTTPQLEKITVPTVVIAGGQDQFIPLESMRAMAAHLPKARFFEATAAGHVPMLETPEVVTAALKQLMWDVEDSDHNPAEV